MMEMSQYFVNISDRHYVQIVFLTLFILCFFRGHSLKIPGNCHTIVVNSEMFRLDLRTAASWTTNSFTSYY